MARNDHAIRDVQALEPCMQRARQRSTARPKQRKRWSRSAGTLPFSFLA